MLIRVILNEIFSVKRISECYMILNIFFIILIFASILYYSTSSTTTVVIIRFSESIIILTNIRRIGINNIIVIGLILRQINLIILIHLRINYIIAYRIIGIFLDILMYYYRMILILRKSLYILMLRIIISSMIIL
jgi:hypothetical protein